MRQLTYLQARLDHNLDDPFGEAMSPLLVDSWLEMDYSEMDDDELALWGRVGLRVLAYGLRYLADTIHLRVYQRLATAAHANRSNEKVNRLEVCDDEIAN
jgi:hypothetical protein